jgi:site-specific recombinase XerD
MKLSTVVDEYVGYKRSLGMHFVSEGFLLKAFCRNLGDVPIARVSPERVLAFLEGSRPPTSYWGRKHRALSGLYRFALARGYAHGCPLPREVPKFSQSFVPYIYSREELKRLLVATKAACGGRAQFDGYVFRALLLLLYGAGLRISEALALTMADVKLDQALVCIRQTKFYKTRLVPLGKDLNGAMIDYALKRNQNEAILPDAPFFCFRDGRPLSKSAVESGFRRLRALTGVVRQDGARYQPRLHDLRHSAAVHRLIAWYRSGADLQRLLPKLATYLGHVDLSATQRYLTLTPELLREASLRFERYAMEAAHD